jgi:hypothetical protein
MLCQVLNQTVGRRYRLSRQAPIDWPAPPQRTPAYVIKQTDNYSRTRLADRVCLTVPQHSFGIAQAADATKPTATYMKPPHALIQRR